MEHYPNYLTDLARQLRKRSTSAEQLLWQRLRRHQLNGLKFKRQHRIGGYIVDFYCAELNLIVEVEGESHNMTDRREYDEQRFEELDSRGFKILRIRNEEVLNDVGSVLEKISAVLNNSDLVLDCVFSSCFGGVHPPGCD